VAGKQAAEMYGLQILAANINYNSNNYTRFIVISNEAEQAPNANKITVVVAVKHEPGSLYRTLGHFYHSGLNMMNLESRQRMPVMYFLMRLKLKLWQHLMSGL